MDITFIINIVIVVIETKIIFHIFISFDIVIWVAKFNNIHKHKSWNVDTVNTKLENFVFIIPMSKKIFDITGIEVIATPIVKIKPKEMVVPFSPIKYFWNIEINGIVAIIGIIVAPKNSKNIDFLLFLSNSKLVL